jgi:hypothetical protein
LRGVDRVAADAQQARPSCLNIAISAALPGVKRGSAIEDFS